MSVVATLVFFCAAVVAASLLGGGLPLSTVLTHTRLQIYLSFSAGAMLGAAFFHMLPAAVEVSPSGALTWAAIGLLALFFVERSFAFHHHESPADPADPCPTRPHSHEHRQGHSAGLVGIEAPGGPASASKATALQWKAAAIGLGLHSLAGGVALASGVASYSTEGADAVGWGVFLATLVHKPADALTIVTLMLRAGVPRRKAHLANLFFSLMIPLGCVFFFLGLGWVGTESSQPLTANVLGFSAGTFLCIALSDLLPELQFHTHDRLALSAALLLGVGLTAIVAIWA